MNPTFYKDHYTMLNNEQNVEESDTRDGAGSIVAGNIKCNLLF